MIKKNYQILLLVVLFLYTKSMNKDYRLKKKIEIDNVFLKKHSVGNSFFSIFYIKNNLEHFRFSLSIGRKYGNAVSRNLIKRRLRYIVSLNKNVIGSFDFVIVIKKDANKLDYKNIKKDIEYFFKKAKLLISNEG